MSIIRVSGLLLLVLFTFGCSNDDGPSIEADPDTLPQFQVIGQDASSVYQYTQAGTQEEGSVLNLTELSGVNRQYITLRQTGDLVSFFSFASDNFSLVIHDTGTNSALAYPNFYAVADERAISWGSNSESQIFLGFYTPRGTRNYNVRILDPVTDAFSDVQIAFNITQAYQPIYHNGRLILPFRDSIENYQVAIVDTDNAALLQTLDFGGAATSVFINAMDELVVLSSLDQANYQYTFYDLQTLFPNNQGNFVLSKFFAPGPLQASISNDKLYYTNFFPQPYPLTSGPAVFDLATGEDQVIDILSIVEEIETEIGEPIVLTDIHFFEEEGLFAVGYAEAGDLETWDGGIIFLRTNGEIVYRRELPFVPTYIVR